MICDDVLAALPAEDKSQFRESLSRCVILKANNVYEYMVEEISRGSFLGMAHLPPIPPPWENIWVEYKNSGALISYSRESYSREFNSLGVKWGVHAKIYIKNTFIYASILLLDERGNILDISNHEKKDYIWGLLTNTTDSCPKDTYGATYVRDRNIKDEKDVPFAHMQTALMAIAFTNCKNVTTNKTVIDEKLRKKRREKGKLPIFKYYTLNINPIKQVLKTEGSSDSLGIKKALHICRGHFANYEEGKGLFGRLHGTYWVPMHVKGNSRYGEVKKDYKINI
jgi:hypothetical protein